MDKKNAINSRRKARDFAFKLIYESNVQKDKDISELIADTEAAQEFFADKVSTEYIKTTLIGVTEKREEIDGIISENAKGWKLNRISATSGAILRLAIYEMLYSDNVPFVVAINEAVELAKKYDHDKAPRFINGILNAVAEQKGLKPAKNTAGTTDTAENTTSETSGTPEAAETSEAEKNDAE